MRLPFPVSRAAARRGLVGLAAALLLGSCGREDGPPPRAPGPRAPATAARPAPSAREIAAWNLDRITQGILPRTAAFEIPYQHDLNLKFAIADLTALPEEALELLSSPEVQRRWASRERHAFNPLHGILDVLAAIDPKPVGLVIAWAAPAADHPEITLRRRAARVLASARDPAAGPMLLALLGRDGDDPEVGRVALRALVALGGDLLPDALKAVYRSGGPSLWEAVPGVLRESGGPGGPDRPTVDALAAWALLAEVSGPGSAAPTTERWLVQPWLQGGLPVFLDPATVWWTPAGGGPEPVLVGPLPAAATDRLVTIPTPRDAGPVGAVGHAFPTGRHTAAVARCHLCGLDSAAAKASVTRDLESEDPVLALTATHCACVRATGVTPDELRGAIAFLDRVLERPESAGAEALDLQRVLALLGAGGAEGTEALFRALRGLRPPETWLQNLEIAHDALARLEPARLETEVVALLRAGGADARVARHLIRRARDPRYLPVLEQELARGEPGLVPEVRRDVWWIYTKGTGVEPAALSAFAKRYAEWVAEAPDGTARALATGLLDLGEEGERRFAEGLRGPRWSIYMDALVQAPHRVSPEIAVAACERLDRATSTPDRRRILIAAYRTFPPEAAPALEEAVSRLDPEAAAEAADVVEAVRHRVSTGAR